MCVRCDFLFSEDVLFFFSSQSVLQCTYVRMTWEKKGRKEGRKRNLIFLLLVLHIYDLSNFHPNNKSCCQCSKCMLAEPTTISPGIYFSCSYLSVVCLSLKLFPRIIIFKKDCLCVRLVYVYRALTELHKHIVMKHQSFFI